MQGKNQITFEWIVEEYRQPLTRAACHLCGNRDAAYDIVQETLIDAYKGFVNIRDSDKVRAWLYTILRRKAIAYRKYKRCETELTNDYISDNTSSANNLLKIIVIEQMSKLNDADREILAGKYLYGLSYRELSEVLGIKEGTVRVRCFRAIEVLRDIMNNIGVSIPQSDIELNLK